MQVMYSATENQDTELTDQVSADIEDAKVNGSVDTDEVSYVNLGSGRVLIIDKENGESTVAEADPEEEGYSLEGFENPDTALEKYLHPEADGVTPNENVQTEVTESVEENHLGGKDIADAVEDKTVEENAEGDVCPECGNNPCKCEEDADEDDEEQHEFSNVAMSKLFSDSEFYCRLFSEVVSEGKPAIVGDLKIELSEEDPETIVVTDIESGDAAQVNIDENGEAVVNELQKECSDEDGIYDGEQFNPLYVVGVNTETSELIDAPVYSEEDAEILAQRLSEIGIEGVEIFEDQEEAREHAMDLLGELDVTELEAHAEPEEKEFSDFTVFTTRYFSDYELESYYSDTVTEFMDRMFSEAENEISDSQDIIEAAIADGEQVEDDNLIITPIDSETAIVTDKDNEEYTKVTLEDEDMDLEKIDEEEADELTKDIESKEDEEKAYSEYELNLSLYSEDADAVAEAIEKKEEVDNDSELITPISDDTAIVYDKDNDEFTKVTLNEDKDLETEIISEEEAEDEIKSAEEAPEEKSGEEKDDESASDENKEKEFSTLDKFFADAIVDPNTGDAVEAEPSQEPAQEPAEDAQVSVEGVEDKALEAVQSIQEAANEAVIAIQQAKEAPAPGEEEDIKEAHFSETENTVMENWLNSLN